MIQEKTQRLADLTEQLSEALMAAAICADEMRAIVHTELDSVRKSQVVATETTRIRPAATQAWRLSGTGPSAAQPAEGGASDSGA